MKSAYAPLPFSYLSSDAKPKVGLRKDGVYGTSADVSRSYQPEAQDQSQPHDAAGNVYMSMEHPYGVYANANALNTGAAASDIYRGIQQPQQLQQTVPASADHPVYSQDDPPRRFQEANPTRPARPQKPEGGFLVYPPSKHENPYGNGRISPKELDVERRDEPPRDYGYRGLAVAKRPQEERDRPNAVARVIPSHYPPSAAAAAGTSADYETVNYGVGSSAIYQMEQPKQTAVTPRDFDNFILVKDPNRPDPVVNPEPSSSAANNDQRRNNNLQTLFEADESRKQLPRYIAQPLDGTPKNAAEFNDTRSNYAIYHGPQQSGPEIAKSNAAKPQPPNYREDRPNATQADSNRSSDAHLVKDKEAERSSASCCVCGKCTAIVVAVIVTAIVCIGAGFIAGWFGAKAAAGAADNPALPSHMTFSNLSTVATSEKASSTKPSAILSTKESATSTTVKRAAVSTTVRSAAAPTTSESRK